MLMVETLLFCLRFVFLNSYMEMGTRKELNANALRNILTRSLTLVERSVGQPKRRNTSSNSSR
jgi:hypothetical protein